MDFAMFYGLFALASFVLAMISKHVPTIKYGFLLLISWAASNLCVAYLGYDAAPMLIAPVNGVIALLLAWLAFSARSRTGLLIFGLFIGEAATHAVWAGVHVVGFVTDAGDKNTYFAILNAIFWLQVAIVGMSGVSHGLAGLLHRRHRHVHPFVFGR